MNNVFGKISGRTNKYLFAVCLLSLFSCHKGQYIEASSIEGVRFLYIPKGIEPMMAVNPYGNVLFNMPMDTIIYNREIIERYVSYINGLKPVKRRNNDFRIYSILKLKDKRKFIHVGFGALGRGIVFKQQQMEDNPELFNWLDSLLYHKNMKMGEIGETHSRNAKGNR